MLNPLKITPGCCNVNGCNSTWRDLYSLFISFAYNWGTLIIGSSADISISPPSVFWVKWDLEGPTFILNFSNLIGISLMWTVCTLLRENEIYYWLLRKSLLSRCLITISSLAESPSARLTTSFHFPKRPPQNPRKQLVISAVYLPLIN